MEEQVENRLGEALGRMEQVLTRLEAQYETLHAKVERIVAAVEEPATEAAKRKTLSPTVSALLAKSGIEVATLEAGALDKALSGLSVDQRIAVKAELARAGVIE